MSLIDRIVRIVFKGEDQASPVAQSLWQKLKGMRWADVAGAFYLVKNAVAAAMGAMRTLFVAADEVDGSLRKLEGTSRITGTPLRELQQIAERARKDFGLSTVTANDLATATANLANKAGGAVDKQRLLGAVLDIGAAKGMTAQQALQAFEQSILGIDEGTDKLFGKNPSGLWADYAAAIGKAPGKLSDAEKQQALVFATMQAGERTQGSYVNFLETAAGRQSQLNENLKETEAQAGRALEPLRVYVIDLLGRLLKDGSAASKTVESFALGMVGLLKALEPVVPVVVLLTDVLVSGLALAFRYLMLDISRFANQTTVRMGAVAAAIGGFVEKSGGLLKRFGIDVVAETGATLRAWGEAQNEKGTQALDELGGKMRDFQRDASATWDRLWHGVKDGAEKNLPPTRDGLDGVADGAGGVADATAKAGDAIRRNFGPTVQDLLGVTEQAMKDLATQATQTLEPRKADDFTGAMDVLRRKVDAARASVGAVAPKLNENTDKARDLTREVSTIARGALDLAQAFGVVDGQAAAVLNSVVNIATALPKALAGDLTSMAGILGGVANIAQQLIGGDAERRRLLQQNTQALAKLSRDIGGLKLNITGDDFVKAQQALSGVVGQLRGGRGAANEDDVRSALFGVGLTMTDLERIAKEFGIELRTKSGALNVDSVSAILEALNRTNLGRLGQSFGDQLQFFRDTQEITGTAGTAGGLGGLLDFLRNVGGVRALDGIDLSSPRARQQLVELFTNLNNNGVAAGDLGRLTGSQLMEIIKEIITGLGRLPDAPAASADGVPSVLPGSLGDDVTAPIAGAVPPAQALLEAIEMSHREAIPLLTEQVALQLRIADATEATALHTRETVSAIYRLIDSVEGDAISGRIDEELARRRSLSALAQGGPVTL